MTARAPRPRLTIVIELGQPPLLYLDTASQGDEDRLRAWVASGGAQLGPLIELALLEFLGDEEEAA